MMTAPDTPNARRIRRAVFTALRTGTAPTLSDLAAASGLTLSAVQVILDRLLAAGVAIIKTSPGAEVVVVGADGITVVPTPHQLVLDGLVVHTWCAFDTVGIAAALGTDAIARTRCPTCDAPIELVIVSGEPPASTVVGWWPLETAGPIHEAFCPTASMFCSIEHLQTWRSLTHLGN